LRENFDKFFMFLAGGVEWSQGHELVDDPRDPGGLTKYGISQKAHPELKVKNLTLDEAREVYYTDYWIKAGCDYIEAPADIFVADAAVNMGVDMALSIYRECGTDPLRYLLCRIRHYGDKVQNNPKLLPFHRGWVNRVIKLFTVFG
jgi:Glycosyl hydrolase 108